MAAVAVMNPIEVSGARKRRPDSEQETALSETKLPHTTMLYLAEELVKGQDTTLSEEPQIFWRSAAEARQACTIAADRVRTVEVKPLHVLRVLQAQTSEKDDEVVVQEALCRGADGALLRSGAVALVNPSDVVTLIDDDKVDGKQQALLTDMFTKMSLGVPQR